QNRFLVSLVEAAVDGERNDAALGRGHFHRLKVARQQSSAEQLPLPHGSRRQVGPILVVNRRLSQSGSCKSGESSSKGELFQAMEHEQVRVGVFNSVALAYAVGPPQSGWANLDDPVEPGLSRPTCLLLARRAVFRVVAATL